jgi:hypothetical protein
MRRKIWKILFVCADAAYALPHNTFRLLFCAINIYDDCSGFNENIVVVVVVVPHCC